MFGKLLTNQIRILALLLLVALLLVSVTASTAPHLSQDSDQCIQCHSGIYNDRLEQTYQHPPFFERRCIACHLAEGSEASVSMMESNITGTLVSQEIIWGKITRFTSEGPGLDHLVSVSGLEQDTAYRFRMVNGTQSGEPVMTSAWFGLQPVDLNGTGSVLITEGLDGSGIDIATISLASNTAVIISWQTPEPLYGWVDVQLLEGDLSDDEPETADADGAHPPLRDPEDLAIEACYECHPRSTLGTSHPVRLYSRGDVQIPDDLPTVDGMLTCVTCHDPHAAQGKMLVREVIKTKLCVTCHIKFKNSSPSTMFD